MSDFEPNNSREDASGLGVIGLTRMIDPFVTGWYVATSAGFAGEGPVGTVGTPLPMASGIMQDPDAIDWFSVGVSAGAVGVELDLFFLSIEQTDTAPYGLQHGQSDVTLQININIDGALSGAPVNLRQTLGTGSIIGTQEEAAENSDAFFDAIVSGTPSQQLDATVAMLAVLDVETDLLTGQYNDIGDAYTARQALTAAIDSVPYSVLGYSYIEEQATLIGEMIDQFWTVRYWQDDQLINTFDDASMQLGRSAFGTAYVSVTGQYSATTFDGFTPTFSYDGLDYSGIGIRVNTIDQTEIQDALAALGQDPSTDTTQTPDAALFQQATSDQLEQMLVQQDDSGNFTAVENAVANPNLGTQTPDIDQLITDFTEDADIGRITGFVPAFALGGDDIVAGDSLANTIYGEGGNDSLSGLNGNDSLVGDAGNDTLDGGNGDDILEGGFGDDSMLGGAGDDNLRGGDGDDFMHMGAAPDEAWEYAAAGAGNDQIVLSEIDYSGLSIAHWDLTNSISATVNGVTNTATIDKGSEGTTTITDVNNAIDGWGMIVEGTGSDDTFDYTLGDGQWVGIMSDIGSDTINLSGGDSIVRLQYFNPFSLVVDLDRGIITQNDLYEDTVSVSGDVLLELQTTYGSDDVTGSARDESFILQSGNDTLDAGGGFDRLRYDRSGVDAVTVNLEQGRASGVWNNEQFLHFVQNVEYVEGSRDGGDYLTGDALANQLDGNGGNDLLIGGLGNDTLQGGEGNDTLNGGSDTSLSNADGADAFEGGDGDDWVSYEGSFGSLRIDLAFSQVNTFAAAGDTYDSIENVIGSQGADNIRGTINEANHIMGGRNVDYIFGRSGDDTLEGGIGDDVLFGGVGIDMLIGGANRDRAQYSEAGSSLILDLADASNNTGEAAGDTYDSIEDLAGGYGEDIIYGDANDNRLFGREGLDSLYGREGDDYLNGGANADRLDGGAGNDTLRGGQSADTFVFSGGDDVIEDFSFDHGDGVDIDLNGITAVADLTGIQAVQTFGAVVGGNAVLDFGAEGSLTLQGVSDIVELEQYVFVFA